MFLALKCQNKFFISGMQNRGWKFLIPETKVSVDLLRCMIFSGTTVVERQQIKSHLYPILRPDPV